MKMNSTDVESGERCERLVPEQQRLIYLVGDEQGDAVDVAGILQHAGYKVRHFSDGAAFREIVPKSEPPAAVIMDLNLPEGEKTGKELIDLLHNAFLHCPPVLFISYHDDIQSRLAAYRAGAYRYLVKPVETDRLRRILEQLTCALPSEPYRVLLVDEHPQQLVAQVEALRAAGMEVYTEDDPLNILDVIRSFEPEVLVLDIGMRAISATGLAAVLRREEESASLPIIFLSNEAGTDRQMLVSTAGGDDILIQPVEPSLLITAVTTSARRSRELYQGQFALRRSLYEKEREQQALNQHAIVSIADATGKIIYVNDRFCQISGYSREELVGKNHRIVKSDIHPKGFYRDMWRSIVGGNVWQGEVCNRRKNGELYWVESSIVPFMDENGKPYQYVSIRTDITQIKQSEQALRAIVKGTSWKVGHTFFDTSVECLAKAMGVRFGFIAELDSKAPSLLTTVAMWDTDHVTANFSYGVKNTPCENVLQNGLSIFSSQVAETFPEDVWLKESGVESYIGIPLYDTGGKFLGHMGVMDDKALSNTAAKVDLLRIFAARVAGEIERRRSESALQQSDERLRRSQVFANIGTWDWNIQTDELFWSERIAPLFGYSAGDLETTYENFLNAVHPDDRGLVTSAVSACVEKGEEYNIEHRVVWPDGTVRWVQEKGDVVRDENDAPLRMLGVVIDIHDRKMAEEAQRESEQKFRHLFELSPVGIALNDMDGTFLEANQSLLESIGYTQEEYRSLTYWQLTPEKYYEKEGEQLEKLKASGRYGPYEKEYLHKDGHLVPVLLNGMVVVDRLGQKRIWSIVQDISERKNTENALEESRQRLLEAQQLAHIGNWEADLVTGRLEWSDVIHDIFGLDKDSCEPSVKLFQDAVHPADRELVQESERRAAKTGKHDVVHRILRPDGAVRYVHELATSKYSPDGQLIGLSGTVQDITELKRAEQDLVIFRRIFDSTEQGIGVTGAEGHLIYSNKAHDRIHGYRHEDIVGKHFSSFFSEETQSWAPDVIMRAINAGKGWSGLLPVLRPDGTEVMTAANVGFVASEDGSPQYLFNIMSDYTEEQRRQQQLAEAKEAAERASQAKSDFLSSMSHELRTPMNAILGFSQILEYDDVLGEDQQDSVHEIIKAGRHLLELINEVLDLAKIESGRIELSLEPVKLADVVDECFSLTSPVAEGYGITLRYGDMDGHFVRADRTRLKQVLLNLLTNAIKYNCEHGVVELDVAPVNHGELRITISDTGKGIAEEQLEQLFQPFNRLDAEGSEIEGTGIGLSITRNLVEMMGGRIGVDSKPGQGSKFWVELPSETFSLLDVHAEQEGASGSSEGTLSNRLHTMLYIEDNPANLKLVSQILAKRQHIHLVTAHEPEIGLELAAAHRPELILLDINMPRMDGYQILSILRSDPRLKDIPVVAVTANAMPRDIERGKAAGFIDYLTKPLDVARFLAMVDRCLGGK